MMTQEEIDKCRDIAEKLLDPLLDFVVQEHLNLAEVLIVLGLLHTGIIAAIESIIEEQHEEEQQ
jgi:hypothetical protein